MLLPEPLNLSPLLNFIVQTYLTQSLTVCILSNILFEFDLSTKPELPQAFLIISRRDLKESLEKDVYNFSQLDKKLSGRTLEFDYFVLKLTAAIEDANCEAFIAFQDDIPIFVKTFSKAAYYAAWRLRGVKFLFAYYKDLQKENYFDDKLFEDQPNILIIEVDSPNSTKLKLKTNKFVGSLKDHPEELYVLDYYDLVEEKFEKSEELYPDKLNNLLGREIILGLFDYRPNVVVVEKYEPQWYDHNPENPRHSIYIDGTEPEIFLTFCKIYNCSIEVYTAIKGGWGETYPNGTGSGLIGMLLEGKAHAIMDSMYMLDTDFMDASNLIGRAGIASLVPRPVRKSSWAMLLRPFELNLWLGVILYLIMEIIALFMVRYLKLILSHIESSWLDNFIFSYSLTFKPLISQATTYSIAFTNLRIILLASFLINIVIGSAYSGGLAAILTIPTLTEPADTLERLARHNLLWTADSEYWIDPIKTDTNPIMKTIASNFRVNTLDNIIKYAEYENMGFGVETSLYDHFANCEFLTDKAIHRLKLPREDIYYRFTMPFVPRLWPFMEKFNKLADISFANGLIKYTEERVTRTFLNKRQQDELGSTLIIKIDHDPVKLDMENYVGLILVWLVGITISTICFFCELLWHALQEKGKI